MYIFRPGQETFLAPSADKQTRHRATMTQSAQTTIPPYQG